MEDGMSTMDERAAERKRKQELDTKRKQLFDALELCKPEMHLLNDKWKIVTSQSSHVSEDECSFSMTIKEEFLKHPKKREFLEKRLDSMKDKLLDRAVRWKLLPFAFTVLDTAGRVNYIWYLDENGNRP
jgi:hypothetical protein